MDEAVVQLMMPPRDDLACGHLSKDPASSPPSLPEHDNTTTRRHPGLVHNTSNIHLSCPVLKKQKTTDCSKTTNSGDRYKVLKVIGQGTFAQTVCLALDSETNSYVVIKSCDKANLKRRKQVVHTETERSVLLRMKDFPLVVKLIDTFQTSRRIFFVLDYCPGGELFYHLSLAGRFTKKVVQFYAAEVLAALHHCHQENILYRDLKPENVLLDKNGHVKLADFGFSKQNVSSDDRTYSFCGSAQYLSPEMISRNGHSLATDMWSFGCFCYELLTGSPPFETNDNDEGFKSVFERIKRNHVSYPSDLFDSVTIEFIKKCLVANPTKRMNTREAMLHPFFNFISDWEKDVIGRNLIAPIKISDENHLASNFDAFFTSQEVPLDLFLQDDDYTSSDNNSLFIDF